MTRKRAKPNQFEARLIQLLKRRFEQARLTVQDHLKVGKLPLEIDMLVRSSRAQLHASSARLPKLFRYFRRHNVLEIKTEQTPLKVSDLLKLHAYTWLYMEQRQIYEVAQVTATVIAHHLPAQVRAKLRALKYHRVSKGVYKNRSAFDSYLLDLSELPEALTPVELQIFTNAERRERVFIASYKKIEKQAILNAITDLYESEAVKLMVKLNVKPQSMRKFVEALGTEKVAKSLRQEELLSAINKKALVAAIMSDEKALHLLLSKMERKKLSAKASKTSRRKQQAHAVRP
ncbi:hypothetical protein HUU05_16050 [candidate division KSB1 bacterium]|nr:hypothetical protein [candidate division KSB1 bacterium]